MDVRREKNKMSYARSGRLSSERKEQCIENKTDSENTWKFDMMRRIYIARGRRKKREFTAPAQVLKNVIVTVDRVPKRT